MSMLRELLLANKAPVVIATVHDVGYALCEIAENPRHTSNNGVSRLACYSDLRDASANLTACGPGRLVLVPPLATMSLSLMRSYSSHTWPSQCRT